MRVGIIAAVAAVIGLAASGQAQAQQQRPCQERSAVLAKLAKDFEETPVAIGMAANGGVLEVLAATADANTFTIIVTMPNGVSCLLASGRHFEMLEAVAAAKGDPA